MVVYVLIYLMLRYYGMVEQCAKQRWSYDRLSVWLGIVVAPQNLILEGSSYS